MQYSTHTLSLIIQNPIVQCHYSTEEGVYAEMFGFIIKLYRLESPMPKLERLSHKKKKLHHQNKMITAIENLHELTLPMFFERSIGTRNAFSVYLRCKNFNRSSLQGWQQNSKKIDSFEFLSIISGYQAFSVTLHLQFTTEYIEVWTLVMQLRERECSHSCMEEFDMWRMLLAL